MSVTIVAEIGQNHQGALAVALDLIRIAADPHRGDFYGPDVGGVDAVKMTKRDLSHELTDEAARRPYTGDNAFGPTYGEHRASLELDYEEHREAWEYAKSLGLDFIETVCAAPAVNEMLRYLTPDAFKVASRDLTNLPLLEAMAVTGIPMIVSTGMAGERELDAALEAITRHHDRVTILHCISQYPAEWDNLDLAAIPYLRDRYPFPVGYSDHSQGIVAPAIAVALGAELIEKHFTLDRQMRGSDHFGAISRDGLWRMVRDVRTAERAMGEARVRRHPASEVAARKLERSVAAAEDIPAGATITEAMIEPLSPGTGIPWLDRDTVIGRTTAEFIPARTLLATVNGHTVGRFHEEAT